MQKLPTVRDWTYVVLIAVLLVAYASGLASQAAKAGETKAPENICLFHSSASPAH